GAAVQNARYSILERAAACTWASDPASLSRWARDFDETGCVVICFVAQAKHRVIACRLCQFGQLPLEPPGERMEPVDARIDRRDQADERIAPTDMLAFVGEHHR